MPPLSWRHHALIQALLSRGPLKEKDFLSIFCDVTGKNLDSHQQLFNEYLRKINMELSYVQFEFRACRNQYDGEVYYGVINNVADEQSKLGTKYSVAQIAFYKGIIEAIVQDATAQGSISNIDALNIRLENQVPNGVGSQSQGGGAAQIPPALRNFSMAQKDKTIEEFKDDQWLCAAPHGKIGLGIRSFLDLRSWFHNNEVPPCDVCNEAGIKADLCPNENCTVRIHHYCLKTKFSQKRVDKACPGCGAQWPYEAIEEHDAPEPAMGKTRRRSRNVAPDEPDGPSESQPPAQSSGRKKFRSSINEPEGPSETEPSGRRRLRAVKDEGVGDAGCGPSRRSSSVNETRKVTRASARLKGG